MKEEISQMSGEIATDRWENEGGLSMAREYSLG